MRAIEIPIARDESVEIGYSDLELTIMRKLISLGLERIESEIIAYLMTRRDWQRVNDLQHRFSRMYLYRILKRYPELIEKDWSKERGEQPYRVIRINPKPTFYLRKALRENYEKKLKTCYEIAGVIGEKGD